MSLLVYKLNYIRRQETAVEGCWKLNVMLSVCLLVAYTHWLITPYFSVLLTLSHLFHNWNCPPHKAVLISFIKKDFGMNGTPFSRSVHNLSLGPHLKPSSCHPIGLDRREGSNTGVYLYWFICAVDCQGDQWDYTSGCARRAKLARGCEWKRVCLPKDTRLLRAPLAYNNYTFEPKVQEGRWAFILNNAKFYSRKCGSSPLLKIIFNFLWPTFAISCINYSARSSFKEGGKGF